MWACLFKDCVPAGHGIVPSLLPTGAPWEKEFLKERRAGREGWEGERQMGESEQQRERERERGGEGGDERRECSARCVAYIQQTLRGHMTDELRRDKRHGDNEQLFAIQRLNGASL